MRSGTGMFPRKAQCRPVQTSAELVQAETGSIKGHMNGMVGVELLTFVPWSPCTAHRLSWSTTFSV
jgi:hypothetical protein